MNGSDVDSTPLTAPNSTDGAHWRQFLFYQLF